MLSVWNYSCLFLLLTIFHEPSSFFFWVLCGICVWVSTYLKLYVNSVQHLICLENAILVLVKLWCRICCIIQHRFPKYILVMLSSYPCKIVCNLPEMVISDYVLISRILSSVDVTIFIWHSMRVKLLSYCSILVVVSICLDALYKSSLFGDLNSYS